MLTSKESYFINKLNVIIVLLFFVIVIYNIYCRFQNETNITEISNNKQTLQLIIPSQKCRPTLYFSSDYRNYSYSNKIKKINLKDKNYFVTFYEKYYHYNRYYKILENFGLIRSKNKYGKNNIFFCEMSKNPYPLKKKNDYDLDKYQKTFSYFNSRYLFQKNRLYQCYLVMKNLFGEEFNYMPETFIFPEDKELIYEKFKNYSLNLKDLWLIKPPNKDSGKGIFFFKTLRNITFKEFVLTNYIYNLNLIKGRKYDLRLYALISGLKPLRIYFWTEGYVRISTKKYSLNENLLNNKFIHITNINVNKLSKNYIKPNTSTDENAHLWNILMLEKYLKKNNIKWNNIREKIKDIIIKSIISVYKNLTQEIDEKNVSDQSFYNLLGYDILITDELIPKLVEINAFPNMKINNNLEISDKTNLFIDTLNLIGITPYYRKTEESLNKHIYFKNEVDDNINNALCELERPRGNYELIFPIKDNINKYNKFFIYNSEENKIFWNKILSHI